MGLLQEDAAKHGANTGRLRARDLPLPKRQAIVDDAMQTQDMDNSTLLSAIHARHSRCRAGACMSYIIWPVQNLIVCCWHCS